MKKLIFLVAFILPLFSSAQVEQKPSRVEYEGLMKGYFTVNDKKLSNFETKLYLSKSSESLKHYEEGNAYAYTSLGFSIVALGSSIWYLSETLKEPKTLPELDKNLKNIRLSRAITGISLSFSLVFVFTSDSKYKKAEKTFNKQFGY